METQVFMPVKGDAIDHSQTCQHPAGSPPARRPVWCFCKWVIGVAVALTVALVVVVVGAPCLIGSLSSSLQNNSTGCNDKTEHLKKTAPCSNKTEHLKKLHSFTIEEEKGLYTVFKVPEEGRYLLYGVVQIEGDQHQEKQAAREVKLFFKENCESCSSQTIIEKSIPNGTNPEIFFFSVTKLSKNSIVKLQFNTQETVKLPSFQVYKEETCCHCT
ncbi:uncharacterized protein LOC134101623 [Sardina pilchardus]|uniref:uncharacterized protein LOC134101623 n=1 Tax=Sardina pilchardus TaxID=27697 RepID=UPI002E0E0170